MWLSRFKIKYYYKLWHIRYCRLHDLEINLIKINNWILIDLIPILTKMNMVMSPAHQTISDNHNRNPLQTSYERPKPKNEQKHTTGNVIPISVYMYK